MMDKKPLIGIIVCILILLPAISAPSVAESDTKLYVTIYGRAPFIWNHTGAYGLIVNVGDSPAYNVSFIFTITGGYNGTINSIVSLNLSEWNMSVPPGYGLSFGNTPYGFGPVTITLSVSASNADNVTKSFKGFQMGNITFIPFTLFRYSIFKLIQWYIILFLLDSGWMKV